MDKEKLKKIFVEKLKLNKNNNSSLKNLKKYLK